MENFKVKLNTIAKVQAFVTAITPLDSDFDLICGRYIVNAKSIMGVFSLDLQQKLELKVYDYTEEIGIRIEPYLV